MGSCQEASLLRRQMAAPLLFSPSWTAVLLPREMRLADPIGSEDFPLVSFRRDGKGVACTVRSQPGHLDGRMKR